MPVAHDVPCDYGGSRMQRIAIILILFIALMNGRHGTSEPPASFDSLVVQARSLMADRGVAGQDYGPLRLKGAWQLTSHHPAFGGISSLLVREDGGFIGLSDTGEAFGFRVSGSEGEGFVTPLPRRPEEMDVPRWKWDSESMTTDPATGRIWVGFEGLQRICRYAPGFAAIEACKHPREMKHWDITRSIESLVRFSDGRFMAIAEGTYGPDKANDVLLWQGDPTDPATPPPVHLQYYGPTGYRPTDALWLGGDRLLVLNRRLTVFDGFTAKLVIVRLPRLVKGARLVGEEIADFSPPRLTDNLEALALSHEGDENGGKPMLWVASDDNHLFLQRSLLLKFALPSDWVSQTPAP